MQKFELIILAQCNGKLSYEFVSVISSNIEDASMMLVTQSDLFKDCLLMDKETLSPITFDTTLHRSNIHDQGTTRSDMFACTYNKLLDVMIKNEGSPRFIKHRIPFCRLIKSKSGRAGDFFTMFSDMVIAKKNQQINKLIDSPSHHYERLENTS